MPDDTTAALQEIVTLMRRRVDQFDEMEKRSAERLAKMNLNGVEMPDTAKMREEHEQRMEKMKAEGEKRRGREEQERARLQDEERQFRQALLTELGRHNSLLERLLSRMA